MAAENAQQLKKVLKPVHLWAIGWNYGWGVSGTIGFLIATLIITVMYITFVFSYTELTAAIPHAGGAFAYAYRAMGPIGGLVAGYATLVDFLFVAPAIASGLGSYLHFLYPALAVFPSALFFYMVFMFINIWGVKESALFSLIISLLAVAELLLFMGIISPSFKMQNFVHDGMPFGWKGIFAAIPFAIWFYLAIEGVAMVAEEVEDPKKDIPKGYITGIATLVLLAFGVMIFTGGVTDWHKLSNIDYPLPEAIAVVLGKTNGLTKIFAGIGLFGLIASFHGTILACSRQVFAMARSGYLPRFLSAISEKFNTPYWAIIVSTVIGCIALYACKTDQIIIISALGAIVMYVMSMISLFVLRVKEPGLERPFSAPFYPVFPAIALLITLISAVAIIYYNPMLSLVFFVGLAVVIVLFMLMGKHKVQITGEAMLQRSEFIITQP
jgi:ethanolamine permease